MNTILKSFALTLCALTWSITACATDRGTTEEAVAMVKKAVALIKTQGKERAFSEFSNPAGPFVKGDLYVMVYDMNGTNQAHGGNPRLIGKNLLSIRDARGICVVQNLIETAQNKGKGWVDYLWPNTLTKSIEHKSTYVEKVGDVLVGVGIYREYEWDWVLASTHTTGRWMN